MVSHWSLNDSKSLQVSRTLLSILADLSNAVFWMVSIRPFISKSSSHCNNPLVTVTRAPITNNIIVTFVFHSFSIPLQCPDTYPSFCFLSILRCGQPGQQSFLFLLLIITRSFRLAEIRCSVCISKHQRNVCFSFSRTDFELCIYHCLHDQTLISCTIPNGSTYPPSCV